MSLPTELADVDPRDAAVLRALAAVLEDAVRRADSAVARDVRDQLADEMRRLGCFSGS